MIDDKGQEDQHAKPKRRTGVHSRDPVTGQIKPFVPTAEQRQLVASMAGVGCTALEILHCVPWGQPDGKPISESTLIKHFGAELERGRALAGMRLKKSAYELAQGGDKTMLIFLLKTKHGYSETVKVENSGPNGAPLPAGPILYLPAKGDDSTA